MTYSIQPQSDLEITFHYSHTLLMAFTRWPHYSTQPLSLGSRGPFVSDTSPKCINWEGLGRPRTGIRKSWNHISLTSLLGVVNNVNKMLIKMATNINTGSIYDVYLLAYVCLRRNDSHWRRYRVFSLTWPASMLIYWNKRKRLHKKKGGLRNGLGHHHGRRFIVLGHQYGRRDVMWKHSIVLFFLVADISEFLQFRKEEVKCPYKITNERRCRLKQRRA